MALPRDESARQVYEKLRESPLDHRSRILKFPHTFIHYRTVFWFYNDLILSGLQTCLTMWIEHNRHTITKIKDIVS
jgi:hypothetical protein